MLAWIFARVVLSMFVSLMSVSSTCTPGTTVEHGQWTTSSGLRNITSSCMEQVMAGLYEADALYPAIRTRAATAIECAQKCAQSENCAIAIRKSINTDGNCLLYDDASVEIIGATSESVIYRKIHRQHVIFPDICRSAVEQITSTHELTLMFSTEHFQSGQTCQCTHFCTDRCDAMNRFGFKETVNIIDQSVLSCNRGYFIRRISGDLAVTSVEPVQFLEQNNTSPFSLIHNVSYEIRQHNYFGGNSYFSGFVSLANLDANASYYIGCAIVDIRNDTSEVYHDMCLTTTEAHETSVSSDSTTQESSDTTRDVSSATATAELASQRSSSSSSSGGSLPISVIGGVVGGVCLVVIICIVAVLLVKKSRKEPAKHPTEAAIDNDYVCTELYAVHSATEENHGAANDGPGDPGNDETYIETPPEYAVVKKVANKSPGADVKANHDSNTDYDYAIVAKPRVPARPTQSTGNASASGLPEYAVVNKLTKPGTSSDVKASNAKNTHNNIACVYSVPNKAKKTSQNDDVLAHENPEYFHNHDMTPAATPMLGITSKMIENDVYEESDDIVDPAANGMYSLEQPLPVPTNGPKDGKTANTEDVCMQENDMYES